MNADVKLVTLGVSECGQSINAEQYIDFSHHTVQLTRSFLFVPHSVLQETTNTEQCVLELSLCNYDTFVFNAKFL